MIDIFLNLLGDSTCVSKCIAAYYVSSQNTYQFKYVF